MTDTGPHLIIELPDIRAGLEQPAACARSLQICRLHARCFASIVTCSHPQSAECPQILELQW